MFADSKGIFTKFDGPETATKTARNGHEKSAHGHEKTRKTRNTKTARNGHEKSAHGHEKTRKTRKLKTKNT